ncbi:FUSC family protein [Corynebacterium sp. UBA2622]|uniref:FUSC family protein n=1 Tax=Corynebacterium sp. UBA2622 TaxID=1946393 RepID=UPI0025B9FE70|nr:FUSC family protein [Corynebacterium sp. UBA2622]
MAKTRMGTRDRLRQIDSSIHARVTRVRNRLLPITQIAVAAGFAFWIASHVFGHKQPFFAPISVIIVIGMMGGERIQKALDISIGCILGVLVGDLIFAHIGKGGWQIAVIVGGSLLIASFFSKSQLVSNQVAIGSILIATIMPPGGEVTGLDRTVDAIIGSVVAMLTLALIPQWPMSRARSEIAEVLGLMSSVLDDVAEGLRTGDEKTITDALEAIRDSQHDVDDMASAIRSGQESAKLSPFLWGARRYLQSLNRVILPMDQAVRSTRVLARRAHVLCEDNDRVTPAQVEIIDSLAQICLDISEVYEVRARRIPASVIPDAVNELRALGHAAGMDVVENGAVLSAYVILAQSRSIIVDLLQVCGMSRESAVAVLVPTSETPKYPPEIYRPE